MSLIADSYRLRRMNSADLDLIRAWRNHADVRRFMLSQHEISRAEHADWFRDRSCNSLQRFYLLCQNETPIGFAQVFPVSSGAVAQWGFYVAPDAERGVGTILGRMVIREVFDVERLHKICGQALAFNEASKKLHTKLGFVQEGMLRKHAHVDAEYFDLLCYGLLASEYSEKTR